MNDQTKITVTYSGIVIAYDECRNRWVFMLRGREKSAASLSNAKETIDKPVPKEVKPFEKIPAWRIYGSDEPEKIEVTALAEPGYGGAEEVWIKRDNRRSKEGVAYRIYPQTKKNDEIAADISARLAEMESLRKRIDALKRVLEPLKIEKEKAE